MKKECLIFFIIVLILPLIVGFLSIGRAQAVEKSDYISLQADIMTDDVSMIKLRDISQSYDWQLAFNGDKRIVIVNNGEKRVEIKINSSEFAKNELEVSPVIKQGRTYIDFNLFKLILKELEEEIPEIITILNLDKNSVEAGEEITANILVHNFSNQEITLNYSSGQLYDLFLLSKEKEIWRWSEGKMFTMALVSKDLASGDQLSYSEKIPIPYDLKSGEYIITGEIATRERLELPDIKIEVN